MKERITVRQSNFELLRILCMLMIIGHHLAVHGEYTFLPNRAWNNALIALFTTGGKLGVNIFILISGYFLINARFSYKKLLKLMAQIMFYSVAIAALFLYLGKVEFSQDFVINTFFPISKQIWWFMSAYIVMYCFSPFLNILLKNCDRILHLELALLLIFIQSLVQRAFNTSHLSNVGWFITLYVISSYIRQYPDKITCSNKWMIPVSLISGAAIAVFKIWLSLDFWELTNIVCLLCSVSIFCTFKNFRIPQSKIINAVAKTTLGVYLLHDNYLIRHFLWVDVLYCPLHYASNLFVVFAVTAIVGVFLLCMIIEFIRERLFISVALLVRSLCPPKPLFKEQHVR